MAEVGPGEITQNITPYVAPHGRLCLTDYPGSNEQISYYNANVLSLARSMDLSCVLVTATINKFSILSTPSSHEMSICCPSHTSGSS